MPETQAPYLAVETALCLLDSLVTDARFAEWFYGFGHHRCDVYGGRVGLYAHVWALAGKLEAVAQWEAEQHNFYLSCDAVVEALLDGMLDEQDLTRYLVAL